MFSLFLAWPLAHRARNYFYVNHHSYGGKPFSCSYPGWDIYQVYIVSWLLLIATTIALSVLIFSVADIEQLVNSLETTEQNPEEFPDGLFGFLAVLYGILLVVFLGVGTYVRTMTFNLAVDNTQIDKRHWLDAKLNPFVMIWIVASNLFLIFLTLGFFFPWARVRVARYRANKMTLFGREGLDAYMAQLASEQSAIGEEVASFFDIDIGL